jgi:hypothetical protein
MGGNLFKLGRKPRKEYLVIENTVRSYLNETIGEENYRIPRYYDKKTTFGDLDILVNDKFRNNKEFKTNFAKDLDSTFTKNAGVVVSNNIMDFQVDLFFFNEKYLQIASDFMDYNIGNFIGKITKRFNLKYGDHGLYYVYRRENNEHYLSELHITQDMSQILSFFNLDYDKWKSGFENNIESFEWLIKSKYFSTYTYFKPTANNKKRVEFETFMTWLKTHNITQDFNSSSISKKEKNELISKHFNVDINQFLYNEKMKEERHDVIYSKYNGDIVMNLTNLKGKELGKFIGDLKNYIKIEYDQDFNEFVYNNTKELIVKEILNLKKTNLYE